MIFLPLSRQSFLWKRSWCIKTDMICFLSMSFVFDFLFAGLPLGGPGSLYGDYSPSHVSHSGRSMFGDIPPTPGSGSITLPGSLESKHKALFWWYSDKREITGICTCINQDTLMINQYYVFPLEYEHRHTHQLFKTKLSKSTVIFIWPNKFHILKVSKLKHSGWVIYLTWQPFS